MWVLWIQMQTTTSSVMRLGKYYVFFRPNLVFTKQWWNVAISNIPKARYSVHHGHKLMCTLLGVRNVCRMAPCKVDKIPKSELDYLARPNPFHNLYCLDEVLFRPGHKVWFQNIESIMRPHGPQTSCLCGVMTRAACSKTNLFRTWKGLQKCVVRNPGAGYWYLLRTSS